MPKGPFNYSSKKKKKKKKKKKSVDKFPNSQNIFLFQRINLLYRPTFEAQINQSSRSRGNHRRRNRRGNNDGVVLTNYNAGDRFSGPEDPPPKYTPPPSYSTATGAR